MLGNAVIKRKEAAATEMRVVLSISAGDDGALEATVARETSGEVEFLLDLEGVRCEILHGTVRVTGYQVQPDSSYAKYTVAFFPANVPE